jgi:hypothetical protein
VLRSHSFVGYALRRLPERRVAMSAILRFTNLDKPQPSVKVRGPMPEKDVFA